MIWGYHYFWKHPNGSISSWVLFENHVVWDSDSTKLRKCTSCSYLRPLATLTSTWMYYQEKIPTHTQKKTSFFTPGQFYSSEQTKQIYTDFRRYINLHRKYRQVGSLMFLLNYCWWAAEFPVVLSPSFAGVSYIQVVGWISSTVGHRTTACWIDAELLRCTRRPHPNLG